ncbi:MAG: hypothetical protein Q7J78_05910 [Clostridiales bacterium]|nr:hypothetical protein [Clostridiales bacterium]
MRIFTMTFVLILLTIFMVFFLLGYAYSILDSSGLLPLFIRHQHFVA